MIGSSFWNIEGRWNSFRKNRLVRTQGPWSKNYCESANQTDKWLLQKDYSSPLSQRWQEPAEHSSQLKMTLDSGHPFLWACTHIRVHPPPKSLFPVYIFRNLSPSPLTHTKSETLSSHSPIGHSFSNLVSQVQPQLSVPVKLRHQWTHQVMCHQWHRLWIQVTRKFPEHGYSECDLHVRPATWVSPGAC